jgi:hypothetical protein
MSEDTEERFEQDQDQQDEAELFCSALSKARRVVRDGIDFAKVISEPDLKAIARCFDAVDRKHWLSQSVLAVTREEDLDVDEQLRQLVWGCEEFAPIRPLRSKIRLVWRLSAWLKSGRAKVGEARKIPQKQQDLDPSAQYEITLALPVWLAFDERQRLRTLHHELCHILGWAVTGDGEHEVMEFASTLARFGAGDVYQARAIASFTSRPKQEAELRLFGFDPITRQGLLFPTDYDPALVQVRESAQGFVNTLGGASVTLTAVGRSVTLGGERHRKSL